jgi:hypothetical protein
VCQTWSKLFESLGSITPKSKSDDEIDLKEDDKFRTLLNTAIAGLKSSEDLEIMSTAFPASNITILHQIFPHSIPDLNSQVDAINSNDRLAFLQQWLFFGTLWKAFESVDIKINLEKYVSTGGPFPVLSTRELEQDMDLWEAVEETRQGGKLRRQNKLITLLVDVVETALQLSMRSGSEEVSDLLLAVHALCFTLETKAMTIYRKRTAALGTKSPWLGRKFVRAGWCPHQAEILQDSYIFIMVYYVYLTGPPLSPHDISRCSKEICQLDMIQKYKTMHTDWCRDGELGCGVIKTPRRIDGDVNLDDSSFTPDLVKLASIIEAGKIPLLSFLSPIFGSFVILDVEVVEYEPSIQYIAYSHVWADGMGNPDKNTLPLCQVEKLRRKTREIMGDNHQHFYVWIDTLCVPVAPSQLRKAAILQMRQIYEGATAVVVFDSELMARRLSQDPVETLARIISCRWARRLWTFQEAALAQNLFFQFEDGLASMQVLYDELKPNTKILVNPWDAFEIRWWPPMRRNRDLMRILEDLRGDLALSQKFSSDEVTGSIELLRNLDTINSFVTVWSGLTLRTTQKPEDEVICIATLLDLDLKIILETPKSERINKLFLLQGNIPSNIIFGRMQRMDVDGFRWAPKSFMTKAFYRGTTNQKALCTETGLSLRYSGIVFPRNTTMITPEQMHYSMKLIPSAKREDVHHSRTDNRGDLDKDVKLFVISLGIREYNEDEVIADWSTYHPSTYAIILEEPILSSENDDGYSHKIYGALVSVYHEEGDTLSVRYINQVTIQRGISLAREDEDANVRSKNNSDLKSVNASEPRGNTSIVSKMSDYDKTFGVLMREFKFEHNLLHNPVHLPLDQK